MKGSTFRILLVIVGAVELSSAQSDTKPYFVDQVYNDANVNPSISAWVPTPWFWNETTDPTYGTPSGTVLGTIYAIDKENTVPFLNFSYDPSTTTDYIEVQESESGVTRVAEFKLKDYVEFDYETLNLFKITVQAFDGVYYSDAMTVSVKVTNVPEAPYTVPTTNVDHFTIQENSAGTVIGNPSFTVADGDSSETITWSILSGTGMPYIAINSNNGTIALKADYDRDNPSYAEILDLVVKIKDKDNLSVTVTYSVTITDRNDLDPECSPSEYSFNITSSLAIGTTLATINCTDADITSPNNELTFAFQSSDANSEYFSIDGTNVDLKFHLDLEYGTGPYSVFLLAIDGGTPARTGTATLSFDLPEATTLPPTTTNLPNPSYDALSSDSSLTALLIVAAFAAACILGYVLILCWRWHTFGKCLPDQCPGRDDFRRCCTCCPGEDADGEQMIVRSGVQSGFVKVNEKGLSLGPEAPNSRRKTPNSFFS